MRPSTSVSISGKMTHRSRVAACAAVEASAAVPPTWLCPPTSSSAPRSRSTVCRAASLSGEASSTTSSSVHRAAFRAWSHASRRPEILTAPPRRPPAGDRSAPPRGRCCRRGSARPGAARREIASGFCRNCSACGSPSLDVAAGRVDRTPAGRRCRPRTPSAARATASPTRRQSVRPRPATVRAERGTAARTPSARTAPASPAVPPARTRGHRMPTAQAIPSPRVLGKSDRVRLSTPSTTVVALASTASAVRRRANRIASTGRDLCAARRGSARSAAGRSQSPPRRPAPTGCRSSTRPTGCRARRARWVASTAAVWSAMPTTSSGTPTGSGCGR